MINNLISEWQGNWLMLLALTIILITLLVIFNNDNHKGGTT